MEEEKFKLIEQELAKLRHSLRNDQKKRDAMSKSELPETIKEAENESSSSKSSVRKSAAFNDEEYKEGESKFNESAISKIDSE